MDPSNDYSNGFILGAIIVAVVITASCCFYNNGVAEGEKHVGPNKADKDKLLRIYKIIQE